MKIENTVAKQIFKAGIIEKNLFEDRSGRAIIKLDGSLPTDFDIVNGSPLLRSTHGVYHIIYSPRCMHGKVEKSKPFCVICDLLKFNLYVTGSKHFEKLADVYPEVAWLIKNTNYNGDLFFLAKIHPGVRMSFSLNFGEYGRTIFEKEVKPYIEEKGFRRPFYVMDSEPLHYSVPKPTKEDYKDKIIEANRIGDLYRERSTDL